ncbi:MAG: hypothetical protein LBS68_03830 [Puniceicoccales bacterium]|jgi:hypothetical protein|nr:hypothetical protein [Puniceicoccales bacterium]
MCTTIFEYAASPVIKAYRTLKKEFQKAKEFGENATREKLPPESSGPKPSGRAYLVLAGAVVTLLVPLKIAGCLVSLLLNYAYLPVSLIVGGPSLLLRKIGWMARDSTAERCLGVVAFWLLYVSAFMAERTTVKNLAQSTTVYFYKLHFLQLKLAEFLFP